MATMIELCQQLYPINRSITGDGVRRSLDVLQEHIPIDVHEVPTGTSVLDWVIPKEWNITDAFIVDLDTNEKVVDFKKHNLHIVGYSIPVDQIYSFEELDEHLFTIEEQPDAIPYVTSYYKEFWGFCLTFNSYKKLNRHSKFHVVINSDLSDGSLTYADLVIPGQTDEEIFISTYICHPSMVNNELSGMVVSTFLAKWMLEKKQHRYTYRFVFVPETIGAITYLHYHLAHLKEKVIGGFNISCVGDEGIFSYLPSRYGNNLSDKIAQHVLGHSGSYRKYSFLDRGSDERQYCAPGVDLPICSILRSKFGEYSEYHTSLDNFDLVTERGLTDSFEMYRKCLELFEVNCKPMIQVIGEPQLGKRGLYPLISTRRSGMIVRNMMNFLAYCDGTNDLVDICNLIGIPYWDALLFFDQLLENGLVKNCTTSIPGGTIGQSIKR